jgi:hypothetical protein
MNWNKGYETEHVDNIETGKLSYPQLWVEMKINKNISQKQAAEHYVEALDLIAKTIEQGVHDIS